MVDEKLISVYIDIVHQNNGCLLHSRKVMMSFDRLCGSELSPTLIHYTIHQMGVLVNCLFPLLLLNGEKYENKNGILSGHFFAPVVLQKNMEPSMLMTFIE